MEINFFCFFLTSFCLFASLSLSLSSSFVSCNSRKHHKILILFVTPNTSTLQPFPPKKQLKIQIYKHSRTHSSTTKLSFIFPLHFQYKYFPIFPPHSVLFIFNAKMMKENSTFCCCF